MKLWHRSAASAGLNEKPSELEYVGFWLRAWAGLIDIGLLCALAFAPVQVALHSTESLPEADAALVAGIGMSVMALLLFYLTPGTTPGKRAISAIVVDERTGCPPSLPQQLGRSFGLLLALIPFGLGFLWVAFQPKKQGWHDKLAGTIVVRERRHSGLLRLRH